MRSRMRSRSASAAAAIVRKFQLLHVTIRPYSGPKSKSFTWELDRIEPEVGPTQSKFADVTGVVARLQQQYDLDLSCPLAGFSAGWRSRKGTGSRGPSNGLPWGFSAERPEMTKDWPNKADLASYFAYWRRRVASRGEFAQSDAGRCGEAPPQGQPRVLCRPLPARVPQGRSGRHDAHHNRPAPLRTKGDAGFPEPILHGVRMEEPCVSCLSPYLKTERHVFCACRCG